MTDLEGRYESVKSLGPGTRYWLEIKGGRFQLEAAAWALTGRNIPGTDRPDVRLLGKRQLEGAIRMDGDALVLHAEVLIDAAGDGNGLGHPAPIRRAISERVTAEISTELQVELHFQLYGCAVTLARR